MIIIGEMIDRQSTSPPSGNLVDGLPLDCHTRAVVYEIKRGTAKNDAPPPENGRGYDVSLNDLEKSHRISCGAYHEDL